MTRHLKTRRAKTANDVRSIINQDALRALLKKAFDDGVFARENADNQTQVIEARKQCLDDIMLIAIKEIKIHLQVMSGFIEGFEFFVQCTSDKCTRPHKLRENAIIAWNTRALKQESDK